VNSWPPPTIEGPYIYARPTGKALGLTLYRPASPIPGPYPAAVLLYGGGWIGGIRRQTRWYGRQLARRGMVCAAIDYRRMFRWAFPSCIHDAKAAVRWLRLNAAQFQIDPNRVFAVGNSAGGHLACLLATTEGHVELEGTENLGESSAIQAAISLYGPQDLRDYLNPPKPLLAALGPLPSWYITRFATRNLGEQGFELASPIRHASNKSSPILFIHGTKDWLTPFRQSERMRDALASHGVDTELVPFQGRNHAFDFFLWKDRARCLEFMLDFLNRTGIVHDQQSQAGAPAGISLIPS